jgi:sulfate transport system permease protein
MTATLERHLAARGRRAGGAESRLSAVSGAGLGLAVLWLSLLVLLPLAAVVARGAGSGPGAFWSSFTSREAVSAIGLTVVASALVALVNAVMGTAIAWVLVRDRFRGRRLLEVVIDLPFALPTIVAGLVLLTLYDRNSPVGVTLYATKPGVIVALLFVTVPFVVRTVQPVLIALELDAEEAAASLGASTVVTFRRIVLPSILPAVVSGAALAFGRAMGEYGSVVLISGQLTYKTEVASQYIYSQIENGAESQAAATATVLLLISVAVLVVLATAQSRAARRG